MLHNKLADADAACTVPVCVRQAPVSTPRLW